MQLFAAPTSLTGALWAVTEIETSIVSGSLIAKLNVKIPQTKTEDMIAAY